MIFDAGHSFLLSNAFPQGGDCGASGRKYFDACRGGDSFAPAVGRQFIL
jgi:hypothetical protein